MDSEDLHPIESIPLASIGSHSSDHDVNSDDHSSDGGLLGHQLPTSRPSPFTPRQYLTRASIWIICSVTMVLTSKSIMVNHEYHYPAAIASKYFAMLLVIYGIIVYLATKPSGSGTEIGGILGIRLSRQSILPDKRWTRMLGASVAAAASIPLLLEGILHMPSLPVLVMLFPMVYATESLILWVWRFDSQKQFPLEVLVTMGASSIILYNEYRLMVPGLICGVTGILLIGAARAFFIIGSGEAKSEPDSQHKSKHKSYHGFTIMSCIFGCVISLTISHSFEQNERSMRWSTIGLMILNVASFIGASFAGSSPLAYSPISFADQNAIYFNVSIPAAEFIASAISSIILVLLSICLRPVVVSDIQIASYMMAILSIAALQVSTYADLPQGQVIKWLVVSRKPSKLFTVVGALSALLACIGWMISSFSHTSIDSIPSGRPANLDLTYAPSNQSRFDIVVSMYDESPEYVKSMLNSIKSTTLLQALTPNIIVYTKKPDADLNLLKKSTGADSVHLLENLGREGATYLHHIVGNWDSLAEQTMFIQAHVHNIRELLPRINNYLVPATGMLSLGFAGVVCDCNSCTDRWGWEDKFKIIPPLYQKIYNQPCDPNTQILLSYKGQFVASAKRIRGINKSIYEDLLNTITSKDGWSHDPKVIGYEDSPDNPYFGFAVERIWGVLMQCTDMRVAIRCPSLLSGMGRWGKVEDCQCLD